MWERYTGRPVFNFSTIGWDGRLNEYNTSSPNGEGV
jgi:hypothetical protein